MWVRQTILRVALIAVTMASVMPAARSAEASEKILHSLQQAKILDNKESVLVLILSDEVLLSISSDAPISPDAFKHAAVETGKIVYLEPALKSKKLRLVVTSPGTSAASEITMNDGQGVDSITIVPAERSWVSPNPVLVGTTHGVVNAAGANFRSDRTKLATRLQALEKKGVGVKLYNAELLKADESFNQADFVKANETLSKLAKLVDEQETRLKTAAAPPTNAFQSAHAALTGSSPVVGLGNRSSAAEYAARMGVKGNLGDFSGSSDAYYDEVARQMLARELGDLAPIEGAFRLERFRLAKKIQELKNQGTRVDSYRIFYRKIEDLAASKDPRKIAELRDNIQYLQKQLGLSQLQGGSH